MFSVRTTPEKFKNKTISGDFGFVFEINTGRKITWLSSVIIIFEKLYLQKVFRPLQNADPAFSNSSGLKSIYEKLCFPDGLVWAVDLGVEKKLCIQISLM